MDHFMRVFVNLYIAVKQCYQIGHYKIGQKFMDDAKIQNSNVTF